MTGRILVGTCSWTDKTLIDSGWYPPEAKNAGGTAALLRGPISGR